MAPLPDEDEDNDNSRFEGLLMTNIKLWKYSNKENLALGPTVIKESVDWPATRLNETLKRTNIPQTCSVTGSWSQLHQCPSRCILDQSKVGVIKEDQNIWRANAKCPYVAAAM